GSSAGAANQVLGFSENGSFEYNSGSLPFASTPSFGSSPHVAVFRREKDSLNRRGEFIMDGAKQSLAGSASGSITLPSSGGAMTVAAGKMLNGTMSAFEGEIYEVIVASKSLNDFAIRRLEGYLAHKWGGVSNLGLTHPFKISRPLFGGSQSIHKETNPAIHGMPIDTASGLPVMSVHDDPFDLKGSYATSGLDLVYTSSNPSVLSVTTDGKLKGLSAGTVTVTMSQPGDNYFDAVPNNQNKSMQLKIIGDYPQSITFDEIPAMAVNATLDLNGSSSRGLPVSFEVTNGANLVKTGINNSGVATGTQLTFGGVGDITIKATQDGNITTAAAAPITRSFKVKYPVKIVFDPIGLMGNGQSFEISASVLNAANNQFFPSSIAPTPVFSIVSGPATVSGKTVTCGNTSGDVTIRAIVDGPTFMRKEKDTTFTLDATKQGQIINALGEAQKTELPDLPLSRKPIYVGALFKSSSGLPINVKLKNSSGADLDSSVAKIIGTPGKQMIAFAPKDATDKNAVKNAFQTDAKGKKYLSITLVAEQAGNGSFHPAAPKERTFLLKPPSKDTFLSERRMDDRYSQKKKDFKSRIGISGDKGDHLFDSDGYDSDGDGVSNLLERAFGGDSLSNDSKSILPKRISKGDNYEYISFTKISDDFNSGNDKILYIVEGSTDNRTWSESLVNQTAVSESDLGGGMQRVVYKSANARANNGQLFIRVRVKTR
ncbi:MAG: hypothetical protein VX609_01310, partial [Verrucomicrobiota bacterium]|nr:hypothetical protein [Verrucomicrobiota bacterium]